MSFHLTSNSYSLRNLGRVAIFTTALLAVTLSGSVLAEERSPNMQAGLTAIDADDYATAMREFKIVADNPAKDSKLNVAIAQYGIAWMYKSGSGVPKSMVEAAKWYRLSAENGNPIAQRMLGALYLKGDGVMEDPEEGWAWIRKAAANGDQDAAALLKKFNK